MANKIILLYDNSVGSVASYTYADIIKQGNIKCTNIRKKEIKNIFLKILRKVHLSIKIAKFINLPFKWIWYDMSVLDINKKDNYNIIVTTDVFWNCDISVFKRLSKYKNVKLTLIIWDTIGVNTPTGRIVTKIFKDKMWTYVYSYDINDVRKYNLLFLNEHYYSKPEIKNNENPEKDAYFIGGIKPGRTEKIIELFKALKENGIDAKFDIVKNDGNTTDFKEKGFNVLDKRATYSYVLDETLNSNCIIEYLQKGQNAQSLRYFEAVCFNKKLLTTNKNIKNLKFYNEKYMKIFEKPEDIDFDWVKKREKIDYGYNGEFSPIYLLDEIKEMEKK